MPRRPRPASRKPPPGSIPSTSSKQPVKLPRPKAQTLPPPAASDQSSEDEGNPSESEDEGTNLEEFSDDENGDVDAPRVAQWVDDEELDNAELASSAAEESADGEEEDLGEGPSRIDLVSISRHICYLFS